MIQPVKDDYDAGGIRRLSAEQRKLLGAAGGGQPTLGTGQTGAAPWIRDLVASCLAMAAMVSNSSNPLVIFSAFDPVSASLHLCVSGFAGEFPFDHAMWAAGNALACLLDAEGASQLCLVQRW